MNNKIYVIACIGDCEFEPEGYFDTREEADSYIYDSQKSYLKVIECEKKRCKITNKFNYEYVFHNVTPSINYISFDSIYDITAYLGDLKKNICYAYDDYVIVNLDKYNIELAKETAFEMVKNYMKENKNHETVS